MPECVEFVDKHDARGLGLGLRKQIPDARGAHAYEHFHELRAAEAEERHLGFAGDRPREERLAGSGWTDEQDAFRDVPTERRVLLRSLQKFHDLAKFFLGFVNAGHIGKFHLHVVFRVDFGAAARKRHDAALGASNTTEEKAPDANQKQQRQHPAQDLGKPAAHDLTGEPDVLLFELLNQRWILDPGGGERFAAILLVGFELARESSAWRP